MPILVVSPRRHVLSDQISNRFLRLYARGCRGSTNLIKSNL